MVGGYVSEFRMLFPVLSGIHTEFDDLVMDIDSIEFSLIKRIHKEVIRLPERFIGSAEVRSYAAWLAAGAAAVLLFIVVPWPDVLASLSTIHLGVAGH